MAVSAIWKTCGTGWWEGRRRWSGEGGATPEKFPPYGRKRCFCRFGAFWTPFHRFWALFAAFRARLDRG